MIIDRDDTNEAVLQLGFILYCFRQTDEVGNLRRVDCFANNIVFQKGRFAKQIISHLAASLSSL